MSRREMMVNSARAIAGLALTTSCRSLGPLSSSRGFKIGVCDWTIGKRTNPASIEMAKRLGLDGVQVDLGSGENDLPLCNPELQKTYIEAVKQHDVQIASLALATLNNIPYKSDPRAERWVSESIDVCKAMDVNIVLLAFFGKGDLQNDPKGADVVVERLRKVAPKAEDAGVFLGFESWLSAEQHMDIIERVGSPAVKVYYDVANSHKAGYDIYEEIRLLGKQICEFHAKDYDDLYGKGTIAFEEVRKAMDDIGYRGWIVMEGVKMPLGLEDSIRYDTKYLRGVFPPRV
ncbi:MAG: TIM barrel protein [Phycisphaerae bacterium]|nr:sugar phosphate isomerase/epimerase [Phycisphaerae bacterium]NIP56012.1 sugar phosphate isomerase/epimerase [Phycisphaerae bacterium]NIS54576.1 sugar phosphate isomerase/epimerase [Phycisphaerae bacterium]NIU10559.1 sugar phosphate isomerase/epimerase [Phycisphaerae bacterium]NIU60020.1 TIM barrel protein [Phycisphaerae bacterium]